MLYSQDNFFYKITQSSDKEFKIEVPSTKKRYNVILDPKSEVGFNGLPMEWERCFKQMDIKTEEITKSPLEVLLGINYVAT